MIDDLSFNKIYYIYFQNRVHKQHGQINKNIILISLLFYNNWTILVKCVQVKYH